MKPIIVDDGAVHGWFGLSYANYCVLPRAAMQSMPKAWQRKFVALMDEMDAAIPEEAKHEGSYRVSCIDRGGRFVADPCPHYDRGRTRIPLNR